MPKLSKKARKELYHYREWPMHDDIEWRRDRPLALGMPNGSGSRSYVRRLDSASDNIALVVWDALKRGMDELFQARTDLMWGETVAEAEREAIKASDKIKACYAKNRKVKSKRNA